MENIEAEPRGDRPVQRVYIFFQTFSAIPCVIGKVQIFVFCYFLASALWFRHQTKRNLKYSHSHDQIILIDKTQNILAAPAKKTS